MHHHPMTKPSGINRKKPGESSHWAEGMLRFYLNKSRSIPETINMAALLVLLDQSGLWLQWSSQEILKIGLVFTPSQGVH